MLLYVISLQTSVEIKILFCSRVPSLGSEASTTSFRQLIIIRPRSENFHVPKFEMMQSTNIIQSDVTIFPLGNLIGPTDFLAARRET